MGLIDILQQYAEPSAANAATAGAHFDEVAAGAPPGKVGDGLAAAFKSDQTPPFGDMVAKLFGQSNGQQQAGLLNQLLRSVSPAMVSALAGGVLGRVLQASGGAAASQAAVTPEQASQLTPEQVKEIAAHAEQHDPNIVDQVGAFYGAHPQLVKSLGGMALAVILGRMAK